MDLLRIELSTISYFCLDGRLVKSNSNVYQSENGHPFFETFSN